ncbi:MAG: hypothetical protein H8D72_02275, partial [Planctomycetes bacterium]|nr:hypothetical protein [Planctomycetota bacterium]
ARRFGLVFGADTAGGGGYFVDSAANAELQAFVALSRVLGNLNPTPTERALKSAGQGRPLPTRPGDARLVAALLRALPPNDDSVLPRVQAALQASDLTAHVPSAGHPIPQTDAAGYLGMLLSTTTWAELDAAEVPAAPGADFFPGAVPTRAPRLATELIFPADLVQRGGWLSTGHFAAPGEVVSLRVLNGSANGWSLRIGAHRDTLWHKDTWSRWPEITRERALPAELDDDAFEVASPFGGLVYLVPGPKAKAARFELSGVVEAPYFVLGDATSAADWLRRREAPAPWGELACDGVILTLPSGALRGLDDPVALMTWWNEAMACYPELRGEPQPARPERMVEDIQISAGWMHSGYPVMTHGADDTESSAAVDLATLQSKGNWGYFHEFGHNAQKRDWTFGGTGEVTNNLFSLYLGERMAGIEPWENPWLAGQKKKPAAYFERGADFAEWKRSPGLALMMYAEVQRAFGWEPFQVAMLSYLELAPNERPRSDDEKRDRWLIELSRASARNLGPYFERWGVPTSAAARAEVAELEGWMPASYR